MAFFVRPVVVLTEVLPGFGHLANYDRRMWIHKVLTEKQRFSKVIVFLGLIGLIKRKRSN